MKNVFLLIFILIFIYIISNGYIEKFSVGCQISEQGNEQDKIKNKISKMIKQNEDNNNIILKQVNESLSKVEDKSDEKLGLKQEVDIEEKEYKTFRDKYNA